MIKQFPKQLFIRTFASHGKKTAMHAFRLRSDKACPELSRREHILTPLSEESLRPERSRTHLCGVVEGQVQAKVLFIILLFAILLQACMQVRLDAPPALPTAQDIETITTEEQAASLATSTSQTETPALTATEIFPTPTSFPKVTISAIKGNLFIRRGPDLAYKPIGVLYKDTSAPVIQRDVLSNWVQITIPNSDNTGWVSIQTDYSKVDGDLKTLPEFTPTDWPIAAYLRNCTHHQMYVMPSEIILPSSLRQPENEIWLYPGSYTVYDIDVAGEPEVLQVDIREGITVEILDDGLGEHRKCP